MNDTPLNNIPLRVCPSFSGDDWIVYSVQTGSILMEGGFATYGKVLFFSSPDEAKKYALSLNSPDNPRQYLFEN